MDSDNDSVELPEAFIKKVAFTVHSNYELSNSPFPIEDEGDNSFSKPQESYVGRKEIQSKFLKFLKSADPRGVYLVTGYRGMGKTSFVNKTLSKFQKDETNAKEGTRIIQVNLAQRKPTEEDILRSVIYNIYDDREITNRTYRRRARAARTMKVIKLFMALILGVAVTTRLLLLPEDVNWGIGKLVPLQVYAIYSYTIVGVMALLFLAVGCYVILFAWLRLKHDPYHQLENLYKRCYASITSEKKNKSAHFGENLVSKIFGSSEVSESINNPIASSKELEYGLTRFLQHVRRKSKIRYIFVFDELDKIEPAATSTSYYEDMIAFQNNRNDNTYLQQIRERKQAIISIFAGLKNFLTTAEATFIFIAGREMFDATLADISDRQSSISSIFNYVFYVETFLKESDNSDNKRSLSNYIERYLFYVLFGRAKTDGEDLFKHLRNKLLQNNHLKGISSENFEKEVRKLIFSLQNFVIYLSYRCNGSPKKIINAIHQFIITDHNLGGDARAIVANTDKWSDRYLYFSLSDQYRIGFINYLYRPFLIKFGRSFKNYSDNIVSSTPYLFDHLLKFHPFAFSESNLELIPEVLSASKTPSLRDHIKKIIEYLANNHMRETEIGLFDFKFYSRTQKEIIYITKSFEEESAAFNFTLDESYLVKLHVRSKIKELRSIYADFKNDNDLQIYSIAYMNGVLGDLHFFDQEFDDAIVAYSDAIKPISNIVVSTIGIRDFVTLIKNQLKLGLTLEKIKSYEDAHSYYDSANQAAFGFINSLLSDKDLNGKENAIPSSNVSVLLQLVNQCFLAKVVLEEKMGLDGVNLRKIAAGMAGFFPTVKKINSQFGGTERVLANVYLIMTNLLYYKNQIHDLGEISKTLSKGFEKVVEYKSIHNLIEGIPKEDKYITLPFVLYLQGLRKLYPDLRRISKKDSLEITVIQKFYEKCSNGATKIKQQHISSTDNKYIGIFLSHMGDCLLSEYKSCKKEKFDLASLFDTVKIEAAFKNIPVNHSSTFLDYVIEPQKRSSVNAILYYYFLSGIFFLRRGRMLSYSFQLRKILYVLRLVLKNDKIRSSKPLNTKALLRLIEVTIVHPVLNVVSNNCSHTDRHMINKYLKTFAPDFDGDEKLRSYCLHNISNAPEARECVLLFSYIRLGLLSDPSSYGALINNYNSITTQFARVSELNFAAKLSLMRFDISLREQQPTYCKHGSSYLYSLLTIIKTLNVYGLDYMVGYSFLAHSHYRVAVFVRDNRVHIPEILRYLKLSIKEAKSFVVDDAVFHFQMAKFYWNKAIELHSGGYEYTRAMDKMIYLEDDINDNAYHFGAALDRCLMGNKSFETGINNCDSNIAQCSDYTLAPYVDPFSSEWHYPSEHQ